MGEGAERVCLSQIIVRRSTRGIDLARFDGIDHIARLPDDIPGTAPERTGAKTVRDMGEHIAVINVAAGLVQALHIITLDVTIIEHGAAVVTRYRHQVIDAVDGIIHIFQRLDGLVGGNRRMRVFYQEIAAGSSQRSNTDYGKYSFHDSFLLV